MSEMVERVARVICGQGEPGGCPSCSSEDPCGDHWRNFLPLARAAIEIMREHPHEPILEASKNLDLDIPKIYDVWRAVIDAALSLPTPSK